MRELVRVPVGLAHVVVVRDDVHRGHFMLFFPFHPSVLEPNLDLPLREAEGVGDLYPPPPGQVPVEMELFFQLQRLVPRVRRSLPFCLTVGVHCTCNKQKVIVKI